MKLVAICATLASIHSVARAFDCAPASGTFEISTVQDIESINQCKKFTGNITLAYDWTESDSISFDGLEEVAGSLISEFQQNGLRSISAPLLRTVDTLRLQSLYNLTSANFPALNNFTELEFLFVPNLVELNMPSENVASEIRKISLNGLSNITDLDWMIYPNIKSLSIMSCPRLSTIRLKNTVVDLKQSYEFKYLESLHNFDVSELVSISGTFDVSEIAATSLNFSKLESISGVLTVDRSNITQFTLPISANITGLVILESYEEITDTCRKLDTNWPSHVRCEKVWRLVMATPAGLPGGNSLSAGAISGIVIGSVVAIGVLVGAALLWRRRRRRNALKPDTPVVDEDKAKKEKARLSLHELESPMATLELPNGQEKQELHAEDIKENDGASVKELDATGENARRGSLNAEERDGQGSTGRE
ncbi:hypothetical protein IQ07DRAFT_235841 [Pyrenochaeta sp. DS3sAY3a]|nr:hypothetical protein IQ07DRAFT_235841 [Pyrenochaeta sp. DS3sAY3a]